MPFLVHVVFLCVALLGHSLICVAIVNRLHSLGWNRWFLRVADAAWCLAAAGIPLWIVHRWWTAPLSDNTWRQLSLANRAWIGYSWFAVVAVLVGVGVFFWRRCFSHELPPDPHDCGERINLVQQLGCIPASGVTRWIAQLPGNEILTLAVQDKSLTLARLPRPLAGLSIVHLSDWHFTGQLTPDFYREVVRQNNALDPDLVVITGDIVDKANCLEWGAEILGQLRSRHGVFFVLGNHELRIRDEKRVRAALMQRGLQDLGGRWTDLPIQGCRVILAGNELPWFRPAADWTTCPTDESAPPSLRVAVCHSPDQWYWARRAGCDLMLAGHTHGGQVRLPGIGPVFAPSRYGVRYASGTFFREPTVMHVSRGLAGTRPWRWNCPPEIPRLTLRCPTPRV